MALWRNTVALVAAMLMLASIASAAFLGTTGGLKGKITDLTNGEPLPGVNVLIVGSGRGAVTNEKGEYSVTGVNPSTYSLRVSLLGYKTIATEKTVLIEADETAIYNFKMASEDIELDPVVAIGTRPLVDVGKTSGEQTFNKDKIEQLPNVKGATDVIGLQAGVVKFGGQLFLRGGRANETQILIDGVAVNDVGAGATSQANEQLQQLYSGNSTAGVGGALSVSANAIQSVSVSSSGLDAEFGNAQSGIVNITTKSGGDTYNGSFQYRTDSPTPQSYNERYFAANLGGPEPITSYLFPAMGVEVPGKLSFFMSANFNQYDGPYDFTRGNFYNPLKRKIKFGGFLGHVLNGLGFSYSDRQENTFSYNTKLSYAIGESDQFSYSYRANAGSSHSLYGAFAWRDRRDSTLSDVSLVDQNVIQWTHIFGTNSLMKGYISRLSTDRVSSVGGLDPTAYTFVEPGLRDPSNDGFYDLGTSQSWGSSNTVVWNVKFNFDSQVHRLHFLKSGFEYFYEHVKSTSISFPADNPEDPVELADRGDFPGVGRVRWVSNNFPSRGAFFLQDNIEFSSINIRIGIRYDFFYLGKQVFDSAYVSRWETVTGEAADWLANKSFGSQLVRGAFSPRLAIGYPISRSTVFYFNYGHFLQYPERDQLYHDPVPTAITNNYVGNPSLKPQKTVQYEAGFDQLILEDLSLGIRGFYKDIFDYVAFKRTLVDKYVNLDYASARGFEIIVTKQLRERWSGSLGYTFQLAKGRSSDPRAAQLSPALFGLPREVRLDWDQQHTVNVFLGYRVGPKEEMDLFGLNINNWGASITWNYGSGFPYTPYNPNVRRNSLEELYLKNTGDGPLTSEVNFSLYKGFSFMDKLNITLTMDITNLLNRRNVDLNAGGFNSLSGRPAVFGDYAPEDKYRYPWGAELNSASFAARVPPYIFRSPRQIAFGLRINWE
jgi:outer membrane receptor protein involved in Fe transport